MFWRRRPQAFRYTILRQAFDRALAEGYYGTDESSLVEHDGHEVKVLMGSDRNIKITKPSDLPLARLFIAQEREHIRERPDSGKMNPSRSTRKTSGRQQLFPRQRPKSRRATERSASLPRLDFGWESATTSTGWRTDAS